jgi:hypothetical protein
MLAGGVIVENGVDHFARREGALDGVEEADEFLVGMALHAAAVVPMRFSGVGVIEILTGNRVTTTPMPSAAEQSLAPR